MKVIVKLADKERNKASIKDSIMFYENLEREIKKDDPSISLEVEVRE
ncbi:MAG: hypothetical protein LKJ25_00880 [Clostridia bacterium]|jgi:hypothetical protein|nr:hypothetical protein [Clostridia bacterium]